MAKKIIAWLLVVVLTAGAAIGGTLAYLTDRDSEANVFTVGDEAKLVCLNEGYSTYWDAATSSFRLKAN